MINAKNVDQAFMIDVWKPLGVTTSLPVVYVLDGNSTFALVAQTALGMIYAGELPPMLIVGVGYKTDNPIDAGTLRIRDYTPTTSQEYEKHASAGLPIPNGIRSGGGKNFLKFINEELKPFIAERYSTNPEAAALVGYSLAGLFAMYVALESPTSFSRYLVGSPYLEWDDNLLFQYAEKRSFEQLSWNVRLFLSAGGSEAGILDSLHRMRNILEERQYEGLEWSHNVFPDETHSSGLGVAISRGLRALYGR